MSIKFDIITKRSNQRTHLKVAANCFAEILCLVDDGIRLHTRDEYYQLLRRASLRNHIQLRYLDTMQRGSDRPNNILARAGWHRVLFTEEKHSGQPEHLSDCSKVVVF